MLSLDVGLVYFFILGLHFLLGLGLGLLFLNSDPKRYGYDVICIHALFVRYTKNVRDNKLGIG